MVGVLGAGVIGCTLAQHLQDLGISAILANRLSDRELLRKCALVFVTVKAYALKEALDQWTPHLQEGCVVVVCCNGDVEPIVNQARTDAAARLLLRRGLITFGGSQVNGRWEIVGQTGRLYWGDEKGGEPVESETWMLASSPRLIWEPAIRAALVVKWIANATVNSIAAAYNLRTNGEILEAHADEFSRALDEALAFAEIRWPDVPLDAAKVRQQVERVVKDTSGNQNSMARDISHGQQTEVDFLTGIVPNRPNFSTLSRLTDQILKKSPS